MDVPLRSADHVSVTLVTKDGCRTAITDGRRPLESRECAWPLAHVLVRHPPLVVFFLGLKTALKVLVRALYLFPVLIVAKIAFWIADSSLGDLISLVFVGLVLITFFLLSILVALYPFVGPPSVRKHKVKLDLVVPDRDNADRALVHTRAQLIQPSRAIELADLGPKPERPDPVRIRGRIGIGARGEPGEPVVQVGWVERDGVVASLCMARVFALEAEGQPPVVIELDACPWLIGEHRPDRSWPDIERAVTADLYRWLETGSSGAIDLDATRRGAACVLHEGDEIEVIAWDWQPVPSLDALTGRARDLVLGSSSGPNAPYRGTHAQPALVVRSTPAAPAILRALS
jgi:hypothetical protein